MAVVELSWPDYSTPPTAEEVERKIKGANWWPQDEGQIALARHASRLAIAGSVQRFLKLVRWEPFVSNGEEETRTFNRIDEEGRVHLGDGLLSLTSVSVLGRAYTVGTNVYAEPENAPAKGKPYTSLLLWSNTGGGWGYGYGDGYGTRRGPQVLRPRAIAVTGEWGYCRTWPHDVYEAIISRAGALALSSVNQESELSSISQDGYSESYDLVGPIDQKTALNTWGQEFEDVAASYARKRPGPMTLNTGAEATRNARNYLPTV